MSQFVLSSQLPGFQIARCGSCGYPLNLTSSSYGYGDSPALCGFESPNSSSSAYKKDTLKIGVLQPSEEF
uniref:Uncharacterized protein n=1 Tax=Salix viminalis TaxID=40686 RepID=A0A6N2MY28_SALVM